MVLRCCSVEVLQFIGLLGSQWNRFPDVVASTLHGAGGINYLGSLSCEIIPLDRIVQVQKRDGLVEVTLVPRTC